MSFLGGWLGRLFILPHMLIGIGLLIYPVLLGARSLEGIEVPATVADRVVYRNSDGNKRHKLEINYNYQGKDYFEDIGLSRRKYNHYKKGEKVFVRFLPEARTYTQEVRAPGAKYEAPDLTAIALYIFFAAFWNCIVGLFVLTLYVAPFIEWWLLRFGRVSTGIVKDKRIDDRGEDKSYEVDYTFTPGKKAATISSYLTDRSSVKFNTSTKHNHKGHTLVSRTDFSKAQKGDRINVLYMPKFPKVNMTIEFSDYELA